MAAIEREEFKHSSEPSPNGQTNGTRLALVKSETGGADVDGGVPALPPSPAETGKEVDEFEAGHVTLARFRLNGAIPISARPRESGDPVLWHKDWMPAFAGMSGVCVTVGEKHSKLPLRSSRNGR